MSTVQTLLTTSSTPKVTVTSVSFNLKEYYPLIIKSATTGGVYYGIVLMTGSNQSTKNLMLSATIVGLGTGIGSVVSKYVAPIRQSYFPLLNSISSVESRIIEVLISVTTSHFLDTSVAQNSYADTPKLSVKGVSIIVAADLLGELAADFFLQRSLSVFE